MKPLYQKLIKHDKKSIIFMEEELAHFVVPWHFHPEIEILLILESSGTTYIGEGFTSFQEGDVAIIGENTPHWWKSDDSIVADENLRMQSLIIQFPKEIFVNKGYSLPYMDEIVDLISRSERGIWFTGESKKRVAAALRELFTKEGIARVTDLILLLDQMSKEQEYEYISAGDSTININMSDFERFNKVHGYIIRHFRRRITLEEVARLAKISPTAFCRYFKSHTGKTLACFINEFRVEHACKLLKESDMPVSKIASDCGFNNMSNFNEQFRKMTGTTPVKYRKQPQEESLRPSVEPIKNKKVAQKFGE